MTPEEMAALTDADLDVLVGQLQREQQRRWEVRNALESIDRVTTAVLEAEGVAPGDEWSQPTGAHNAYPKGWTVSHGGRLWESLTPGNAHEPGFSGWREISTGPAAWVQPTGAHDAYTAGDVVTHAGVTWRSTATANVWAPGVYGWVPIGASND